VADARVVGLGEATHGTREFFRLKHRLVRALVERLGCRVVALEANFSETLAVDEYVVHGRGDPREALDGIYFWTWDTEELLALVEWLRAFNEGRPVDDRVRFYGVDAQFARGPAAALADFLAERDPARADHRETLATLADAGLAENAAGDTEGDGVPVAEAEPLVDALAAWFADRGDGEAVALHRRHLRTLEQAVAVTAAERDDEVVRCLGRRDEAMADNLAWVADRESADHVAVWAHDAHLQRTVRDTRWGSAPSMGAHLADRYGEEYYALGFDFADGEFQALDVSADHELRACSLGAPPADAATWLFAAVDEPVWLLDFDEATADDRLAAHLDTERAVRSLGAIYDPDDEHDRLHEELRLPAAFDGLAFVAETTRARPIDRDEAGD